MAPDSARYTLAPEALRDLEGVWAYGAETWSADQADRYLDELVQAFDRVARSPTLFRERLEFSHPGPDLSLSQPSDCLCGSGRAGDHPARSRWRQDWQAILRALDWRASSAIPRQAGPADYADTMPKTSQDSLEDTIASRISRALAERIIHGELVPGSRLARIISPRNSAQAMCRCARPFGGLRRKALSSAFPVAACASQAST